MLKDKYIEKEKAGKLAENHKFFNSAVGLYYYNIFLRIKDYLNKKQVEVPILEKSSHTTSIDIFIAEITKSLKKIGPKEIGAFNSIKVLLYKRKKADYDESFIFNEKNYIKDFKDYYDEVDDFLKNNGI